MPKAVVIDLIGQTFGRLTVISRAENSKVKRAQWLCECECGSFTTVLGKNLRNGTTKSCGCLRLDATVKCKTIHGHTKKNLPGERSPTYNSWSRMLTRCTNPKWHAYDRYGGRGIKVCERWLKFENFLADMGERPDGCTLDRYPNKDGDYEPGNVRWATMKQQCRNRRTNRFLTVGCETHTIAEWAELRGIRAEKIANRINILGWSHERALTP